MSNKNSQLIALVVIAFGGGAALAQTFTQASASRSGAPGLFCMRQPSGDLAGVVQISDSTGKLFDTRPIVVPADGTAIRDVDGNQIAASVPSALHTAQLALNSELKNAINAGMTAGKFSRP